MNQTRSLKAPEYFALFYAFFLGLHRIWDTTVITFFYQLQYFLSSDQPFSIGSAITNRPPPRVSTILPPFLLCLYTQFIPHSLRVLYTQYAIHTRLSFTPRSIRKYSRIVVPLYKGQSIPEASLLEGNARRAFRKHAVMLCLYDHS